MGLSHCLADLKATFIYLGWSAILAKSQNVIKNGCDFHDDRSRFYYERSRWLRRFVEIFMVAVQDFHGDKPIFYYVQLRISWWLVEIILWTVTTLKRLKIVTPCHKQLTIITNLASTTPKRLSKEKKKTLVSHFWLMFFSIP